MPFARNVCKFLNSLEAIAFHMFVQLICISTRKNCLKFVFGEKAQTQMFPFKLCNFRRRTQLPRKVLNVANFFNCKRSRPSAFHFYFLGPRGPLRTPLVSRCPLSRRPVVRNKNSRNLSLFFSFRL